MRIIYSICLAAVFLLASGCMKWEHKISDKVDQLPPSYAGLIITDEGAEWEAGTACCNTFEDTLYEVPFEARVPEVPFQITDQAAQIIPASFDLVRMTFANVDQGEQLVLSISNSNDQSEPEGEKGPELTNGTQTWIQSGEFFSGLYWRQDGLTYALLSNKVQDREFLPLYPTTELVQIANSLIE